MISHGLKKCTRVHSVFSWGHVYRIHTSSSSSSSPGKDLAGQKMQIWDRQHPPRKKNPPSRLPTELNRNPQMSVRQETRLILTLGAFSQSSVREHTSRVEGRGYRASTENTAYVLSRPCPVSYRCSQIKHTHASFQASGCGWGVSFCFLFLRVLILSPVLSLSCERDRSFWKGEAISVIQNRNVWSR